MPELKMNFENIPRPKKFRVDNCTILAHTSIMGKNKRREV